MDSIEDKDHTAASRQDQPAFASAVGRKMAKGAAWMVAMRLAIRGTGVISTVILARLLVPEDFGLVALATMLLGILEVMGGFGFDLVLIKKQRAGRDYYDTVWTLTIIRGGVIALTMLALAGPAAAFFEEPRLVSLFYCLAFAAFVQGFTNVGVVDFRKEMEFGREFRFRILIKLSSFVTTITLAVIWRDYWALIAGIVLGRVVEVVLSYMMHDFRPKIALAVWREIMDFSKWLLANNLLLFIGNKADTFILAKVSGSHAVGLYSVAYEISNLPTSELVWPVQRAIYPGYAKLADDIIALRRAYIDVLSLALMLAVPIGLGLGLVADPFVRVVLGQKWLEAIPLLEVLAIFGVLRVGFANGGTVLLSLARLSAATLLSLIGVGIRIPLLIWGVTAAGPVGVAWALVASAAVSLVLSTVTVLRALDMSFTRVFLATWRTILAAAVMAAFVRALQELWPIATADSVVIFVQLLTLVLTGASAYLGTHLLAWRLSGLPDGPEARVLTAIRGGLTDRSANDEASEISR